MFLSTAGLALSWEPVPARGATRRVLVHNLWDAPIGYTDALEWQRQLRDARVQRLRDDGPSLPDTLLLVQHPPVYTLGTASTLDNLRSDTPPFELHRTERGGEVTYHGPGQLVLYPILDLREYRQDVHWYMRSLEEVALRTLGSLGLPGERVEGLTGAWVRGAKVCAIGVKLSRWVTMHGLALNVCPDLSHFGHIVPCGIADRPVTSVAELLGEDAADLCEVQRLLLGHFSDVFSVELVEASEGEGGEDAPAILDGSLASGRKEGDLLAKSGV